MQNNVLFARFRWFEEDIAGYAYFEEVSANRLRGGWWLSEVVPEHLLAPSPRMEGMTPFEWIRREEGALPDWAEAFFEQLEETLKP
ncbi:MAG TPA: hypothetical protein VF815_17645 [Myxococcaceae bacterium]|jgi:hypothetical protein